MTTTEKVDLARRHRNRLIDQRSWRLMGQWQALFIRLVIQLNKEEVRRNPGQPGSRGASHPRLKS